RQVQIHNDQVGLLAHGGRVAAKARVCQENIVPGLAQLTVDDALGTGIRANEQNCLPSWNPAFSQTGSEVWLTGLVLHQFLWLAAFPLHWWREKGGGIAQRRDVCAKEQCRG